MFAVFLQFFIRLLALCDIFNSKEDNWCTDHFLVDLTGIEQHCFLTNGLELMRNLVVIELCLFRKDLLKQRLKRWDIPLSVSNVIDQIPNSFIGCHFEGTIEAVVG